MGVYVILISSYIYAYFNWRGKTFKKGDIIKKL